ncbi:MAG: hypothetical protein CM15mP31_3030 [Gammaproteobacteria bacterium]|nr:MAG: hypothetical protein CM15mP31_3030 [Gammaproteobacteria bacterium]
MQNKLAKKGDCFDISVLRCLTFSDEGKSSSKKPKLKSTKIDESKSHSSEINNQNKEEISKPKDDEKIQETVLEKNSLQITG